MKEKAMGIEFQEIKFPQKAINLYESFKEA
jgi:hypothetical protein